MLLSLSYSLVLFLMVLLGYYMTKQHPPDCCGAYGSSFLSMDPQTDGTMKSRVVVV